MGPELDVGSRLEGGQRGHDGPVPSDRIVRGRLGDTDVLFGIDDRRLRYLNETAAAIWDGLGRRESLTGMISGLADRFGAAESIVRGDVEEMVRGLVQTGLLVSDHGSSDPPGSETGATSGSVSARLRPGSDISCWPVIGSFGALDATVRIESPDPELGEVISGALAPLASRQPAEYAIRVEQVAPDRWAVATREEESATVSSRVAAVARVLGEVNGIAVESVPDRLVLHAGAVAAANGAVVLPAGANHGKSTLTAGLVKAGLAYLSDEAAAIDSEGICHPYPKPIALDPGSFAVHRDLAPPPNDGLAAELADRAWYVDPRVIGSLARARPVVAIVFPRWISGATTVMSHCSREDTLSALVGHSFDFGAGGQIVFEILCGLVDRVPAWRLVYGNGNEAMAAVRDLLAATPDLSW
jgi:hypothetical protein